MVSILPFTVLDLSAAAAFLACWVGFGLAVDRSASGSRPSLMHRVKAHRTRWIERMCGRDNHTADATLLSNLLRGALFFGSTTVLIVGGLVALLGTAPKVSEVVSKLAPGTVLDVQLTEFKSVVLILLFVYAFFKFTWSAWQYNVLSILVGAAPLPMDSAAERASFVESASRIAALAGESYNSGIRAYYFATPLMAWFISPIAFVVTTAVVTFILYRREFRSSTLEALTEH